MRVLICIDDTDNIESIGTGEVLENMCAAMRENGLGAGGFITRHQLFLHKDIAYTSHNSSMCCEAEIGDFESALVFCRRFMDSGCAEGSDPGLCVIRTEALSDPESLMAFGKAAKTKVLKKRDALDEAARHPGTVFLSEHGGTGDGVIGALAGCGLRLSGNDGKVKGKLRPGDPNDIRTVGELCSEYGFEAAVDGNNEPAPVSDTVAFREPGKAIFRDNKKTALLVPDESGRAVWRLPNIKELKNLVD